MCWKTFVPMLLCSLAVVLGICWQLVHGCGQDGREGGKKVWRGKIGPGETSHMPISITIERLLKLCVCVLQQ